MRPTGLRTGITQHPATPGRVPSTAPPHTQAAHEEIKEQRGSTAAKLAELSVEKDASRRFKLQVRDGLTTITTIIIVITIITVFVVTTLAL